MRLDAQENTDQKEDKLKIDQNPENSKQVYDLNNTKHHVDRLIKLEVHRQIPFNARPNTCGITLFVTKRPLTANI